MTSYLITFAVGFWLGAVLTWLYARRLVNRAERMLSDFADSLPRPRK